MLQPEVHQRVPPELDESVLFGSGSRFGEETFQAVWRDVFEFSAG